jgi:hypothetical protein
MHRDTRASDTEREAVIQRLLQALHDGRLSMEEFDERSAKVYAARTHGELRALTRDLPGALW